MHEFERVLKRTLSIICPALDYNESLIDVGINSLVVYYEAMSRRVRLCVIAPPKTNRPKNSFLLTSCSRANESKYLFTT